MANSRREAGEALYRQRFIEFGLSDSFEFLRREWSLKHDKRFWSRCKSCGCEFISWDEVFRGRQSHLLCPHCGASSDGNDVWTRSPKCDEAMAFYVAGHSVKETAEKFGVSTTQINNAVKARRITNGKDWKAAGREVNRKRSDEARIKHEAERIVLEKHRAEQSSIRKKRAEARKRLREIEKANKKREKEQAKQRAEGEKSDALFHLLNDKTHVCAVCGKSFSIADYMKDCGLKQIQHNPSYCSDACKRKADHRKSKECKRRSGNFDRGNHRHRARKYGVAYKSGITLKKVWKRDKGICQICGKSCDWNDRSWNEYCGPLYPSIDHIIAMANGGGHVWPNVQLAHMMCNSEKGDSI